jgi:hypothetical protein
MALSDSISAQIATFKGRNPQGLLTNADAVGILTLLSQTQSSVPTLQAVTDAGKVTNNSVTVAGVKFSSSQSNVTDIAEGASSPISQNSTLVVIVDGTTHTIDTEV